VSERWRQLNSLTSLREREREKEKEVAAADLTIIEALTVPASLVVLVEQLVLGTASSVVVVRAVARESERERVVL